MIPTLQERMNQVKNSVSEQDSLNPFTDEKGNISNQDNPGNSRITDKNTNDGVESGFDYVKEKIKSGEFDNPSPEDYEKPENNGVDQKVQDLMQPLPSIGDIDMPQVELPNPGNVGGAVGGLEKFKDLLPTGNNSGGGLLSKLTDLKTLALIGLALLFFKTYRGE